MERPFVPVTPGSSSPGGRREVLPKSWQRAHAILPRCDEAVAAACSTAAPLRAFGLVRGYDMQTIPKADSYVPGLPWYRFLQGTTFLLDNQREFSAPDGR